MRKVILLFLLSLSVTVLAQRIDKPNEPYYIKLSRVLTSCTSWPKWTNSAAAWAKSIRWIKVLALPARFRISPTTPLIGAGAPAAQLTLVEPQAPLLML